MAIIELTKGHFAGIDSVDAYIVSAYTWSARYCGTWVYAFSGVAGYLHRFLMNNPKMLVDHKNGYTLDCRRDNMRVVTPQQNAMNHGLSSNSKSGVKGVSWDRVRGKWTSHIRSLGKQKNLGRFDDIEAARSAYVMAAEQLHKEYRRLS